MTGGTLLPAAAIFVGVIAANLAFAWLLARRDWEPPSVLDAIERSPGAGQAPDQASDAAPPDPSTDDDPTAAPPPPATSAETVACRYCGAANRPEFRFCRWCVRSGFADADADATDASALTERPL
jgi:hypothetical protein